MKRKIQSRQLFWKLASFVLLLAWLSWFVSPSPGSQILPEGITIGDVLEACGVDVENIESIEFTNQRDVKRTLTTSAAIQSFFDTEILTQVFTQDIFGTQIKTVFAGSYLLYPRRETNPAEFPRLFVFANDNWNREWIIVHHNDYMLTDEEANEPCGIFEIEMHG